MNRSGNQVLTYLVIIRFSSRKHNAKKKPKSKASLPTRSTPPRSRKQPTRLEDKYYRATNRITTMDDATTTKRKSKRGPEDPSSGDESEAHDGSTLTKAASIPAATVDTSDSDDENEDDEAAVDDGSKKPAAKNTEEENQSDSDEDAASTLATRNSPKGAHAVTVEQLKTQLGALKRTNALLQRQVRGSADGGATNLVELAAVQKRAKDFLFKKVKFITTANLERQAMRHLASMFNVDKDTEQQWIMTYASEVREALNNKRNNVAQQLKGEVIGKYQQHQPCYYLDSAVLTNVIASST